MTKKVFLALLSFMMLALANVGFTSCKGDDTGDNPLVGTWVQSHDSSVSTYETITFTSDGKCSVSTVFTESGFSYTARWTYTYNPQTTVLIMMDASGRYVSATVSITGKKLMLDYTKEGGGVMLYTKQ